MPNDVTIDGKSVIFNDDGSISISTGLPFVGVITIPKADMETLVADWVKKNGTGK